MALRPLLALAVLASGAHAQDWFEQVELKATTPFNYEFFGCCLALSGDTLLVGQGNGLPYIDGEAHVYERNLGGPNGWGLTAVLTSPTDGGWDYFGNNVDLDGDRLIVGAFGESNWYGAAHVFERGAGGQPWGAVQKLTSVAPGAQFGYEVAISGDTIAVTAGAKYKVHVFDHGPGGFAETIQLGQPVPNAPDDYGHALALDGDVLVIGADGVTISGQAGAGEVYVHERDLGGPNNWGLRATLSAPVPSDNDQFGVAVAVDGDRIVVGAQRGDGAVVDSGTAYVFERHAGGANAFGRTATLIGAEVGALSYFGQTVDVDGDRIAVGAPLTGAWEGTVHVFELGPDGWTEEQVLKRCRPEADEWFGEGLALEGDTLAVGAYEVDHPVYGLDHGSAFVFRLDPAAPPATYCTAGTSATGCRAQIAACGAPSASAPAGFCLTATGVEGDKDGLFFFGTNGRQAAPWGNGTSLRCVVPPTQRGGLLAGSGSAGNCDGSFTQDLNARWCPTCPKPGHNPGAGAVVQAQLWYRDPSSTSNQSTSLSDGVEFTLLP